MRLCRVCGAHLADDHKHWHETPGWKPDYDDFEGALKGYETVRDERAASAQSNHTPPSASEDASAAPHSEGTTS